MPSKSEKVFYDENLQLCRMSVDRGACRSRQGRHIHHALRGHGGERVSARIALGRELYKVDGYEPITGTVYEFNGCKWHGCLCQPNRINVDKK